jgi:hypothetical protein
VGRSGDKPCNGGNLRVVHAHARWAPHTTPLSGLFDDQGFLFCTGHQEQKTRNIIDDPRGSLHIGSPMFFEGIDIVLRGLFTRVTDRESLTAMIEAFVEKYGEFWRFDLGEDALVNHHGNPAWVFRLVPGVAFSFTRGERTAQTKYEFEN